MSKLNAQKIPWKRLLAEGAAIVVSILFAFWIDASWQSRQEAEQGRRLAEALVAEIAKNDAMLVGMIEQSHEATATTRSLLSVMASVDDERDLNQLRQIGNVFSLWTWMPNTDVYQQALASGQLLLIDDSDLSFR